MAQSPTRLLIKANATSDLIVSDDLIAKPDPTHSPDEPLAEPRTIDDEIDGINLRHRPKNIERRLNYVDCHANRQLD